MPVAPADLAQRLVKADLIARAFVASGIDAVALGSTDWKLGTAEVRKIVDETHLPVLAANLVCDGKKPYPASAMVERAGWRVGIVGVTAGTVDGCEVQDPVAAVKDAVAGLDRPDVTVLLSPLSADALKGLAGVAVDLVVDGETGKFRQSPEELGSGWVVSAGSRTKQVGIATLTPVAGAKGFSPGDRAETLAKALDRKQKLYEAGQRRRDAAKDETARARAEQDVAREKKAVDDAQAELDAAKAQNGPAHNGLAVELVSLGTDVADDPAVAQMVAEAKGKLGAVDASTAAPEPLASSTFAGGASCKACHAAEAEQWSQTAHAHAWASLAKQNRTMDRECFSCHATGVGDPGGPTEPRNVGDLSDVQCEACHGASATHKGDPKAPRPAMPTEQTCTRCHDGDRDGGRFDYATYLPKVRHTP